MQNQIDINTIRTMVRTTYDFQKLRIQMGNRITISFKSKLGLTQDGMSERALDQQDRSILERLRAAYNRITDGIVVEGEAINAVRLRQIEKSFKEDDLITTFGELLLMNHYLDMLKSEEGHFKDMEKILKNVPIYTEWLKDVSGVGPAMAAILISEIDIHKCQYSSSLEKYAGLDVVKVGRYKDASDKEVLVSEEEIEEFFSHEENQDQPMITTDSKGVAHVVTITFEGRSRKAQSLVNREYKDKDGKIKVKKSITFNPFLKTKLIGVLAGSFIKSGGTVTIDGTKMGAAKRLSLAQENGFKLVEKDEGSIGLKVLDFLRALGYEVKEDRSKYNEIYYDYKHRLEVHPLHKEKTQAHRHAMALRYMMKFFLQDLYKEWRALEGLEVVEPYHIRKLGLIHHES